MKKTLALLLSISLIMGNAMSVFAAEAVGTHFEIDGSGTIVGAISDATLAENAITVMLPTTDNDLTFLIDPQDTLHKTQGLQFSKAKAKYDNQIGHEHTHYYHRGANGEDSHENYSADGGRVFFSLGFGTKDTEVETEEGITTIPSTEENEVDVIEEYGGFGDYANEYYRSIFKDYREYRDENELGNSSIDTFEDNSLVYFVRGGEWDCYHGGSHEYDADYYLSNTSEIYRFYNLGFQAVDISMDAWITNTVYNINGVNTAINVVDDKSDFGDRWSKEPSLQVTALAKTYNTAAADGAKSATSNTDSRYIAKFVPAIADEWLSAMSEDDAEVADERVANITVTLQSAQKVLPITIQGDAYVIDWEKLSGDSYESLYLQNQLPAVDYQFAGRINGNTSIGTEGLGSIGGLMDNPWNVFIGSTEMVRPKLNVVWDVKPYNYKNIGKVKDPTEKFVLENNTDYSFVEIAVPTGNVWAKKAVAVGKDSEGEDLEPLPLFEDRQFVEYERLSPDEKAEVLEPNEDYRYGFDEDYNNTTGVDMIGLPAQTMYNILKAGYSEVKVTYSTFYGVNNENYEITIPIVDKSKAATTTFKDSKGDNKKLVNNGTDSYKIGFKLPEGSEVRNVYAVTDKFDQDTTYTNLVVESDPGVFTSLWYLDDNNRVVITAELLDEVIATKGITVGETYIAPQKIRVEVSRFAYADDDHEGADCPDVKAGFNCDNEYFDYNIESAYHDYVEVELNNYDYRTEINMNMPIGISIKKIVAVKGESRKDVQNRTSYGKSYVLSTASDSCYRYGVFDGNLFISPKLAQGEVAEKLEITFSNDTTCTVNLGAMN